MSDFTWKTPTGDTITMPSMRQIPAGVLRKHRKDSELDFMFGLLEDTLSAEELEKVDRLSTGDLEDLFTAWQQGEQATLPES